MWTWNLRNMRAECKRSCGPSAMKIRDLRRKNQVMETHTNDDKFQRDGAKFRHSAPRNNADSEILCRRVGTADGSGNWGNAGSTCRATAGINRSVCLETVKTLHSGYAAYKAADVALRGSSKKDICSVTRHGDSARKTKWKTAKIKDNVGEIWLMM